MERIGPYEVIGRIGRGGSADVLLAMTKDGARCVIKRLHDHLAANEGFVRMFLDEARVMSLLPHPSIVRVFDLGEDGASCYTAMELVDGPNLAAVNKLLRAPMPPDVIIPIGAAVAEALAFVHAAFDPTSGDPLDLVHRDVAAPNILVSRDGDVKLIDFGVVRSQRARSLGIISSEPTRSGVIKGRRSTMSPEQVLGHAVDARADLFSLGVVLWESLAGKKLWTADGALELVDAIVRSEAPPVPRRDIAPALASLIASMLEKAPDARPQTAVEVATKLRDMGPGERTSKKTIGELIRSLDVPSLVP